MKFNAELATFPLDLSKLDKRNLDLGLHIHLLFKMGQRPRHLFVVGS